MGRYALVKDGKVLNMISWDGETEIDFGEGVVAVEMPEGQIVNIGYSYEDGEFTAPPLTPEEIEKQREAALRSNISIKSSLISEATLRINVLQDAVDLEMASDEEAAALPLWKKYRVLLSRIDANTSETINWPEKPAALPPGNVNK